MKEYTVRPAFLQSVPPIKIFARSAIDALIEAKRIFGFEDRRETLQISRIIPSDYGLCG
jgi:hypothetical protein